jgi:3-hydroxybutyryl-CoA dehydratase
LKVLPFTVSRETIRDFCDASLDYNPLHLDEEFMQGSFGETNFGGVIMHGMSNFSLIAKMLTDWAYAGAGVHRRLETRWHAPLRPGDLIRPSGGSVSEANYGEVPLDGRGCGSSESAANASPPVKL